MDTEKNLNYEISKSYEMAEFPRAFYTKLTDEWLQVETLIAERLHEIFEPGNLTRKRLLDFGCGPVVNKMASASRQFEEIVVADYSLGNRLEVEKWLRGDPESFDLTPLLEKTANLEKFEDIDKGVKDIQRRLRERIKMVVHCDGLSKNILPNDIGKFDVITCFFSIQAFAFGKESHKKALEKLATYLNDGGFIINATVFGLNNYFIHKWIGHDSTKEESIKEAIKESGFRIINWQNIEVPNLNGSYCLYTLTKMSP